MKNISRVKITVTVIMLFMTVLVAGFVHRFLKPTIFNKEKMENYGAIMFDKPRIFREFSLLDQNDKAFTPQNFKNKWTLLFFGFTYCPDICPTTLGVLNKFYAELQKENTEKDVQIVFVSVDPTRDTPEKLRDYVRYFNTGFTGVTGEFMSLQKVATDLNVAFAKVSGDGGNYLIEHSGNIVLINPRAHYHGFFKSPFDPLRLRLAFDSARAQYTYDFEQ